MNLNKKTLPMLILMLIGFAFAYMGLNLSPLGFLITLGAWILVIAPAYDHYRTQKKYEEKYSRSQAPSCADFLRVPPSRPLFYDSMKCCVRRRLIGVVLMALGP